LYKNTPILISTLIGTILLISGCGSSGTQDKTTTPQNTSIPTASQSYNVNIIDEAIIGARVSAPECNTFVDNGNGSYTLKGCLMMPTTIEALGGAIDLNGNGIIDVNETAQGAPLKLRVLQSGLRNDFTVSPLTTLASGSDVNLTQLADTLGIAKDELFSAQNTKLQQALNILLISAREAGIVKYDSFLLNLKNKITTSSETGLKAIADARQYMKDHQNDYMQKFGIAFGGFISDTSDINTTNPRQTLVAIGEKNNVASGKIKLTGFVYDKIIADANITIYDANTVVAKGISNTNGHYSIELNNDILDTHKVLKLEAIQEKIKLVSYITTDEIKKGLIGQRLSSGNTVSLIISNVTTAKSVLIEKTDPEALSNPHKLTQTKALIETIYPNQLAEVSAAIQDVVDNNKSINQPDTLSFAQSIVDQNQTTKLISINKPSNIDINTTKVTQDPMLYAQLNNNVKNTVSPQNYRAIIEDKTLYRFDYYDSFPYQPTYAIKLLHSNGVHEEKSYEKKGSSWQEIKSFVTDTTNTIVKWSQDNNILYISGEWQPNKQTLMNMESININNTTVHIYHLKQEIIGSPTQLFYDNFIQTSYHTGTMNFASLNDTNKTMIIYHSDGDSTAYQLNDDGTYSQDSHQTPYKYRTVQKYGKTYVIMDDGQTYDGGGEIYYLDFANQKVYERSYHNIGYSEPNINYDNEELLNVWKNLTQSQYDRLQQMIDQNMHGNTQFNATYTYDQALQDTIYSFVKSLAN
jgi:hypothetical protein